MSLKSSYKYRSVWMGIAIAWVVLYHSGFTTPFSVINAFKRIGYGGVDIFIFASGLGVYFSYTREHSPSEFLKRRLKRLAPVYVPFIIVWSLLKSIGGGLDTSLYWEPLRRTGLYWAWKCI